MAKLSGTWGSREELLHPRGKNGRFIDKAGVGFAMSIIDKILEFLDRIDYREFGSDQQSSQYLFNNYKDWNAKDRTRLQGDLGQTNAALRKDQMDPSTKQFVDMMDRQLQPSTDDLILHRTMSPEALGVPTEMMDAEDGGVWDLPGKVIADKGYSAANIGTPLGQGAIHLTIVAPKGTKIAPTRIGPNDRGIMLDRNVPLAISKVTRDGKGGYHVQAFVDGEGGDSPKPSITSGQPAAPKALAPEVPGRTPEQREEQLAQPGVPIPSEQRAVRGDVREQERVAAYEQRLREGSAKPPPPRREPVVVESLGEAPAAPPLRPGRREPGAPAFEPEIRGQDFADAVREANLESPSAGPRRKQWNDAYLGVQGGKTSPADALRNLETDISVNKRALERQQASKDKPDPELEADIKAQEALADVISKNFGVERRKVFKPGMERLATKRPKAAKKAAPAAPAAAPEEAPEPQLPEMLTPEQREGILNRDRELSRREGYPRNEEEERIQTTAQLIRESEGAPVSREKAAGPVKEAPAPVKKAAKKAVPKKAAPAKAVKPEDMTEEQRLARIREILDMPKDEELPAAVKKAAKKAAPAKVPGDLDTMTKAELLADPRAEGARPSWTKDRIKAHIQGERPEPKKRAPAKKAAPAKVVPASEFDPDDIAEDITLGPIVNGSRTPLDEDGIHQRLAGLSSRQLRRVATAVNLPLGDKTPDGGPWTKGALSIHIASNILRDRRDRRIAERAPSKAKGEIRRLASALNMDNVSDPQTMQSFQDKLDGKDTILAGRDIGRPLTREEVADDIDDFIDNPFTGLRVREKDRSKRGDFDGATEMEERIGRWRQVAARLRGDEPGPPAAQKKIEVPDRKRGFDEAWERADLSIPDTAAGRTIAEIQGDISSGKITGDEGIRRLENDITLNKADLAEIDADLRRPGMNLEDKVELMNTQQKLRKDIKHQEDASKFLHRHFDKAPEVTPDEVKLGIARSDDPSVRDLRTNFEDADADTIKQMKADAKADGLGDVEGDTGPEVYDNILKKIIDRELKSREAKKPAPEKAPAPKAPDKLKPNLPESKYQRIDSRALAEGLDLRDPGDVKMLDRIQAMLDGDDDTLGKNPTPAQIGRYLEQWNNGAAGPRTQAAFKTGVAGNKRLGETDEEFQDRMVEVDAEADILSKRGDEWKKLADRLMNTRRQRARDVVPDVEPKVTRDEKKDIAKVAEVTGIPEGDLQKAALEKKKAEAPPKASSQQVADTLKTVGSREEGRKLLEGRTKAELLDIGKVNDQVFRRGTKSTKADLIQDLVETNVGARLDFEAIRRSVAGVGSPEAPRITRRELIEGDLVRLADLEEEFHIKRTSLDKEERIDKILEKIYGPQGPEPEPPTPGGGAEVPEANRIPVRGGGFIDTRTGELVKEPEPEPSPKMKERANHLKLIKGSGEGAGPSPATPRPSLSVVGKEAAPIPSYKARQKTVQEIADSENLRRPLSRGAQGTVHLETDPDGRNVVIKEFARTGPETDHFLDSDELAPQVLEALGTRSAATTRVGPRTIAMEHIDGQLGSEITSYGDKVPDEIADTDDARLIGLADLLMYNVDRNTGNWIRTPDGRITGIDHSGVFLDKDDPYTPPDVPWGLWGDFSGYLRNGDDVNGNPLFRDEIDISKADVAEARRRLQKLRPEFEERGRGEWHDQMMALLDQVDARAVGKKNRLAKGPEVGTPESRNLTGRSAPGEATVKPSGIKEDVPLVGDPEGDNSIMHGDSATMELAQAYAKKNRNGTANRLMELRRSTSTTRGEDSKDLDGPQKMLDELKRLREIETDPQLQKKLDNAIKEMDFPRKPITGLPEGTPPTVRKLIEDLNRIPVARAPKGSRLHMMTTDEDSPVDRIVQLLKRIEDDKGNVSLGEAEREIEGILHTYHESVDGAYRMWGLWNRADSDRTFSNQLREWIKKLRQG